MPVEMQPDHLVSRCIIFDRAFNVDVHVDEFLWRFESSRDDGTYHESAVLRELAPEDADVHAIGCGIAASQNERKGNPPPGLKRRYYCGFRSARFGDLPTGGENYLVRITNIPENNSDAHLDVELELLLPNTKEFKNKRANTRTKAGLDLADHFGAAIPFRCECDATDLHHPFSIHGIQCLSSGLRNLEQSV